MTSIHSAFENCHKSVYSGRASIKSLLIPWLIIKNTIHIYWKWPFIGKVEVFHRWSIENGHEQFVDLQKWGFSSSRAASFPEGFILAFFMAFTLQFLTLPGLWKMSFQKKMWVICRVWIYQGECANRCLTINEWGVDGDIMGILALW